MNRRAFEEPPDYPGTPTGFPRPGPVTRWLLISNGVAFAVCFLLYLAVEGVFARLELLVELCPAVWRAHAPWLPLWQLLTYGFLHSVRDPAHILFNMLGLYFFGTMLESWLGARRFALTYAGALLSGALLYLFVAFATGNDIRALGASGAVLGVMVACAVLQPRMPVYLFPLPVAIPLGWLAVGVLTINLCGAALDFKEGSSGTAYLVHLGGIAYGFAAIKTGLARWDPWQAWEARGKLHGLERQRRDSAHLDELLARIHREGIHTLSRRERKFLQRVSKRE